MTFLGRKIYAGTFTLCKYGCIYPATAKIKIERREDTGGGKIGPKKVGATSEWLCALRCTACVCALTDRKKKKKRKKEEKKNK